MNKRDSDYILRHLILKRAKKVLVAQATIHSSSKDDKIGN